MTRRKADRIAANVFLVLCGVVVVGSCAAFWPMIRGAFTSPRDLRFASPEAAVRDARALVADRNARPDRYGPYTEPEALPASLQIPDLRYAQVHRDHVDLVVARNPDGAMGARIWSERHRPHRDQPTRYAGIHFFRYTHELPESPDNIP